MHAYLILAHNNFGVLKNLLKSLDITDNHIFLHIDKKAGDITKYRFEECVKNARLILVPRQNVKWGHSSQVDAELLLFETAFKSGNYAWYHLLSGVDCVLSDIRKINNFFDTHSSTDGFMEYEPAVGEKYLRMALFYFFPGNHSWLIGKINAIQNRLGVDRWRKLNRLSVRPLMYGSTWCDLRPGAVKILLDKSKEIRRAVRMTSCADEVYKQTWLLDSGLKFVNNNLRYIDWSESLPNPKILEESDYENMMSSGKFFARKLSESRSQSLIDRLNNDKK